MLRACVGLDYLELLQTLCLVALPRLREVDSLLHTTAALASLSPLREAIARASSSRELSWFGHGRKAVEGEGRGEVEGEERGEVEGEGRGAVEREVREEKVVVVVDGLREVLRICDLSSGCVRGVRECVSEEEEKLLASVSDDLTRTLCTLRIFELSQISRIITELTADTDMKTILPHDMIFQ